MNAVAEEQYRLIESSNYFFNRALKYIDDNDITSAISSLTNALNIMPDDTEAMNLIGLCYYLECDFNLACTSWKKSIKLNKTNNRADEYLVFMHTERFKEFVKQYNLALEAMNKGEYQQALEKYQAISLEKKQYIELPLLIGLCYYNLKEYELSWNYFSKALNLDKGNKNALHYLNQLNDKIIIADKESETDYAVNPKVDMAKNIAIVVMAVLLLTLTVHLAKDYFDSINNVHRNKQNVVSNIKSSKHLNQKNNKKHSKQNVNKQSNMLSNEQQLFNEAISQYKNKDYKDSAVKFKKLIKYATNYSIVEESTYFEASCYEQLDNPTQALNYYSMYIKTYKNQNYYEEALYNAGMLAYKNGERELAKIFLEKLTKETPNSLFNNSNVKYVLTQH